LRQYTKGEILEDKSRGRFVNDGIVSGESITVVDGFPRTIHRDSSSGATTQLCQISIDRGLDWEGAQARNAFTTTTPPTLNLLLPRAYVCEFRLIELQSCGHIRYRVECLF